MIEEFEKRDNSGAQGGFPYWGQFMGPVPIRKQGIFKRVKGWLSEIADSLKDIWNHCLLWLWLN